MFEAHPSIRRRTYEPTMASSASFSLGGNANYSLRDVGIAEPAQKVDRPTASQGREINKRSLFELPAPQKAHIYTPCLKKNCANLDFAPRLNQFQ